MSNLYNVSIALELKQSLFLILYFKVVKYGIKNSLSYQLILSADDNELRFTVQVLYGCQCFLSIRLVHSLSKVLIQIILYVKDHDLHRALYIAEQINCFYTVQILLSIYIFINCMETQFRCTNSHNHMVMYVSWAVYVDTCQENNY